MLVKIPRRYAAMVGLPNWEEGREGQWNTGPQRIAIKVEHKTDLKALDGTPLTKKQSEARTRAAAALSLVGYGIPYQAAKSILNAKDSKGNLQSQLLYEVDQRNNNIGKGKKYPQLEDGDPYELTRKRAQGFTTGLPLGAERPFSTGVAGVTKKDTAASRPPLIPTASGVMGAGRFDPRPWISKDMLDFPGSGEEALGKGAVSDGYGQGYGANSFEASGADDAMTIQNAVENLEAELEEMESAKAQAKADAEAARIAKELADFEASEAKSAALIAAAKEAQAAAKLEADKAAEELKELQALEAAVQNEANELKKLNPEDLYFPGDTLEGLPPEENMGAGYGPLDVIPTSEEVEFVTTAYDPGPVRGRATGTGGLYRPGGDAPTGFDVSAFSTGGNIGNVRVEDYIASLDNESLVSRTQVGLDENNEPVYEMQLNPLVAQMLDIATVQNGYISETQIAQTQKETAVAVAEFQTDAAIKVAEKQGASAEEIADIQKQGAIAVANAQAAAQTTTATTEAGAMKAVATTQAAADEATAKTAAQAASPFGYLSQAGEDRNQALRDIASIYGQMNAPSFATAQASGPFGFVGQAPEAGYTPEQVEQLMGIIQQQQQAPALAALQGNPFAAAIYAQQAAGPMGTPVITPEQAMTLATQDVTAQKDLANAQIQTAGLQAAASGPYGYMQQQLGTGLNDATRAAALAEVGQMQRGGLTVEQQLALARAPGNPFGLTSIEQMALQNSLARGGLTPTERLTEVQAAAAPQNTANYLNFIGNPAAVGFAGQSGFLQNVADSPEGNIPASLFGLNVPQNAPTVPVNPTLGDFRDLSDEQLGFYQGQMAAQNYQTPSQIYQQAQTVTPQGV